jgi:hypothetical protein
MFVQVIQGRVTDEAAVKDALDEWLRDVAPGATGWLGSTGGVTDDGRLIALVRFESAEAARRNSSRPEQDAWWSGMASLFSDEPTFSDTEDVILDIVGEPDEAGFVQVMRGKGTNADRARELMSQGSAEWAGFRPDVIGSVSALHPDGGYTMCIYFTNEVEARAGEQKEPPPELKAQMAELDGLQAGPPEFFDLRQPWLRSPR